MASSDPVRRVVRSLRDRGARATLIRSLEIAARRLGAPPAAAPAILPRPPADRDAVAEMLGLRRDPEYRDARHRRRQETIERLAGCAPVDAFPGEMIGYLTEAALRFDRTLERITDFLPREGEASLLETGSNPYFLTILLHETFPRLRHVGINYFGDDALAGEMHRQCVVDPKHRLEESVYLYADIERHSLEVLGVFDVCLFCEVIEHLVVDPAWALYNLLRRVRIGGRLLLTTPNPSRLENICRLVLRSGSTADPISGYGIHGRHNREYTRAELHDLLSGSGCSVIRSRTVEVGTHDWSRAAEEAGYGEYHLIEASVDGPPILYRPAWLYRSFDPARLASPGSLAAT